MLTIKIILNTKHILVNLLRIEIMRMVLFFLLFCYSYFVNISEVILIIQVRVLCGSAVALSILINLSNYNCSDKVIC